MNITQARALVEACQASLGYRLSRGQITDLLLDNWDYDPDWTDEQAAFEHAQAQALAAAICNNS